MRILHRRCGALYFESMRKLKTEKPQKTEKTEKPETKAPVDTLIGFSDLGLRPELLKAVQEAGYTSPTPIQQQAIPLALSGRDLIGLAQTGTGKTAGFTLPIVHNLISAPLTDANGDPIHRVRVLILTPTRELAAQV